jgi:hypothetical protein
MTTKKENVTFLQKVESKKFSAKELLKKAQDDVQGLVKTSLGKKEEIYKSSLFEGLNDKEKKSIRKKVRNFTYSLLSSLLKETKEENKIRLAKSFIDFYKSIYCITDFSISSICSENTKEEKKKELAKGLEVAKKFN